MNYEIENQRSENLSVNRSVGKDAALPVSIVIAATILAGAWIYNGGLQQKTNQETNTISAPIAAPVSELEEAVLPREGVVLPVVWGDLGAKLVSTGAIDEEQFRALYAARGAFPDEYEQLLTGRKNKPLIITEENAGYLLNLLWALGLASKNPILDSGEMMNPAYGGAENFASTAGWVLAKADPTSPVRGREGSQRVSASNGMEHYSRHLFFNLTPEQQKLVDKVSRGIYRPCCGNSTHFPDCNHGMAMLGLLELMASQGVSEEEIWKAALAVNSYWFPDTYLTIAAYKESKGTSWKDVDPEEILGANYSSASGYARIASQVSQRGERGGSGCGVDAGTPASRRESSGCGI